MLVLFFSHLISSTTLHSLLVSPQLTLQTSISTSTLGSIVGMQSAAIAQLVPHPLRANHLPYLPAPSSLLSLVFLA